MSALFPKLIAARARVAALRRASARQSVSPRVCVVQLRGDIDRASADRWTRTIEAGWRSPCLRLDVDSLGGEIEPALELYYLIRRHPGAKVARAVGAVYSAAVLPFLAADLRILARRAGLLIHHAATARNPAAAGGRWTAHRYAAMAAKIAAADDAMLAIYAERTLAPRGRLRDLMRRDHPVPPLDALRAGIVHQVDGLGMPVDPAMAAHRAASMRAGVYPEALTGLAAHVLAPSYLEAARTAARYVAAGGAL